MGILKKVLLVWGVVSAFGVCGILFVIVLPTYHTAPIHDAPQIDSATKDDVAFVLNWSELGEERIERVVHRYVSPASFNGDGLTAYAIKVSPLSLEELSKKDTGFARGWYRGDALPPNLTDAVVSIPEWTNGRADWFPSSTELQSDAFHAWVWGMSYTGTVLTGYQIIFAHPQGNMVYFISTNQ